MKRARMRKRFSAIVLNSIATLALQLKKFSSSLQRSSGNPRVAVLGEMLRKNLNVSNIFCGLPPPTSFCTLITPIAVSGGWAGYSWVYDSVGTDSHNDYWLYVLDDPNTSVYPELRVLTVDSFFI